MDIAVPVSAQHSPQRKPTNAEETDQQKQREGAKRESAHVSLRNIFDCEQDHHQEGGGEQQM